MTTTTVVDQAELSEAREMLCAEGAMPPGGTIADGIRLLAARSDRGTEKLLRDLLDRAYKMMLMSGYRLQEHNPDSNDPITAWMSDARAVLYGNTKPEPDLARLR